MIVQLNWRGENISPLLNLLLCSTLISGCAGVSSLNRTNQSADWPNHYLSEKDMFVSGKPYEFKLRVQRKSQFVPYNSVQPYITVNGERHKMVLMEDWHQSKSLWSYQPVEECPDVGFANDYGFKYSFSTDYDRETLFGLLFVKRPPQRTPSSGEYHSKVFGAGSLHFAPYAATYDQQCWNTNIGCVASYKTENVVDFGAWPGSPNQFEHTLTLRNLSQAGKRIMIIRLVSYQGNPPNDNFELVGLESLPETIGCEDAFSFKLRYKPGFYQSPNFTRGHYKETGMIQTWIEGPGGQPIHGPYIYIDYTVYENAP